MTNNDPSSDQGPIYRRSFYPGYSHHRDTRKHACALPFVCVMSTNLVGESLIGASEVPTELHPQFSTNCAGTVEFKFKNDYAYL